MDPAKTALSLMGGLAFGLTFVPVPLRSKLDGLIRDLWEKLFSSADPFAYIEVSRKSSEAMANPTPVAVMHDGAGYAHSAFNPFYSEVALYLGSLDIEVAARRISVSLMEVGNGRERAASDSSRFVFGLPLGETLVDTFADAQFSWTHAVTSVGKQLPSQSHGDGDSNSVFTLRMQKSDKHRLLRPYLCHISRVAREIRQKNALRSLYTNGRSGSHWLPVTLKHPSTFDTIALDGDLSERIQADLRAFAAAESYYHRIGRAWKRGYLLYGPPGTGKSSLIAAIANFMRYDIYDLELTNVFSNSTLQTLLMQTTRKSVIVIEDIDCSTRSSMSHRQAAPSKLMRECNVWEEEFEGNQRFTLSGLLNFADGLLSCYGEERIFVFTTNYRERLDSALLRCGRMDMHIHLSYCTFPMFKKLAANYLGVRFHPLYTELEDAMRPGVKITPATIAEILISKRKSPDEAIGQVLEAVKTAEPGDGDGDGDGDGGDPSVSGAANPIGTKANEGKAGTQRRRRRRRLSCGDDEEEHTAGPAGKKQKEAAEEGLSTMKAAGACINGGNLKHRKQEFETLAASGGEEPAAGACTPTNAEKQRVVEEGLPAEAACEVDDAGKAICDMNAMDSDVRLSQGVVVDDSEDSSDEGSALISCRWASQLHS